MAGYAGWGKEVKAQRACGRAGLYVKYRRLESRITRRGQTGKGKGDAAFALGGLLLTVLVLLGWLACLAWL